jgi:quinohemoprotein ethanol dehydrogenase
MEATRWSIDGVLYNVQPWNVVTAYDARPGASCGATTRRFRSVRPPGLLRRRQPRARGWEGKIYVGTLDGRLIALDAKTGERWCDHHGRPPSLHHHRRAAGVRRARC